VKHPAFIFSTAKRLLNLGTFIPRLYANHLRNYPERTLLATGAVLAAGAGIASNESIQAVMKPLAQKLATHESLQSIKSTIQIFANNILKPDLLKSIQESASSVATFGIQNLNQFVLPAVGAVGAGLAAVGLNWKHPFFTGAAVIVGSAFTGFVPGMIGGAVTMTASAISRRW
jgi:hypothetical protein